MAKVVSASSGPQGKVSLAQIENSWDVLEGASQVPEWFANPSEQEPAKEAEPTKEPVDIDREIEAPTPEPKDQTETKKEPESKETKDSRKATRYEQYKRKRAALEAREAALAQREQAWAEREAKAKQPPYTLAELKSYRKVWEKEGNYDLVEKADAEIGRLEGLEQARSVRMPEIGSEEFLKRWKDAESVLYKADPEFQRDGTRLDKVLRAVLAGPDGDAYRGHPEGIYAAYDRAVKEILKADLGTARAEIQKLKQELTRLTGLTSIGGVSAPGAGLSERKAKDFASLSLSEKFDHLKRNAARSPW